MVVKSGQVQLQKPKTGAYKDKSKPADVRGSNINAAKGNYNLINDIHILLKQRKKMK